MKTSPYCGIAVNTAKPILRIAPILIILLLLASLPASAIKRIEANPINIAYMLAQDTDSASMARTLAYYGYQPVEGTSASSAFPHPQRFNTARSADTASADTPYSTYCHPNGSTIRYSFKDSGDAYPYVEVKSKSGNIDAILSNLGFEKQGRIYQQKVNKYTKSKFTCHHGSNEFLIFHKSSLSPINHSSLIINH